ncbi:hypothetical protein M9458_031046, partial [Cirrhinus mrigala]
ESHEASKSHVDPTVAQALSPPPLRGILGPRPGPLPPHPPVGVRPPFMPPFANNGPHPILPPPNMPPQMMPPRGPNPMFGEPPAGRFRMRMMGFQWLLEERNHIGRNKDLKGAQKDSSHRFIGVDGRFGN